MGDIVKYFFKEDGVPHECLYNVESTWETGQAPNYPLILKRIWRKVPGSERKCTDEEIISRMKGVLDEKPNRRRRFVPLHRAPLLFSGSGVGGRIDPSRLSPHPL